MWACRAMAWTTWGGVARSSSRLTTAWRRSCSRTPERPARSRSLANSRERFRGLHRRPDTRGEDEVVVLPDLPGHRTLPALAVAMLEQHAVGDLGQLDRRRRPL